MTLYYFTPERKLIAVEVNGDGPTFRNAPLNTSLPVPTFELL